MLVFLKAGEDDSIHPAKLPFPCPYVMPLLQEVASVGLSD